MPTKQTSSDKLLKDLLQQAIESGDPDLIKLAQEALVKKTKKKGKPGRPSKNKPQGLITNPVQKKGQVGFDGNAFNPADYADKFKEDTELFDKKIKFNVTQRREATDDIEITCSRCNKKEYLPGSYSGFISERRYYVCAKCGSVK